MDFYYEFGAEGMEAILSLLLSIIPSLLLGIAAYVLRAIGIYTIAKRRNIKRPWFAWLPVVDAFLLGCISDQYRYVVKGQNKNKRTILLVLNLGQMLLTMAVIAGFVGMMVNAVQGVMAGISEEMLVESLMPSMIGMLSASMPMMILAIVTLVLRSMALYDLYTSCTPDNNVLFLVLSIFFGVTEPVFIFFSRNKDGGMPPRKDAASEQPAAELPRQTEMDPWDRADKDFE